MINEQRLHQVDEENNLSLPKAFPCQSTNVRKLIGSSCLKKEINVIVYVIFSTSRQYST
jgi:hypothetical protein